MGFISPSPPPMPPADFLRLPLMERIRGWALTDHNVTIPAPNEVV